MNPRCRSLIFVYLYTLVDAVYQWSGAHWIVPDGGIDAGGSMFTYIVFKDNTAVILKYSRSSDLLPS